MFLRANAAKPADGMTLIPVCAATVTVNGEQTSETRRTPARLGRGAAMSEPRLIDVKNVERQIKKLLSDAPYFMAHMLRLIGKIPTVDAVPVVRCDWTVTFRADCVNTASWSMVHLVLSMTATGN